MVKVKSWLFTEVRGKVKKAEFRRRKNKVTELSQKRIPFNPRTPAQQEVRQAYGKCVEEWNKLSESEKREWRIIGTLQGISGYNAFMRECLNERLGKIWYEITIDNSANSNDLTDYQILLEITNDATFFEDCQNEQKYLEFYDTDKATLLNHFVEEFDTTNKNAKIWIKVPLIPANSTKTIYLKINTSRTTDLSNGENVFDFFDDFDYPEGDLDGVNGWQDCGNINAHCNGDGTVTITSPADYVKIVNSKEINLTDWIIEYKGKFPTSPSEYDDAGVVWKSDFLTSGSADLAFYYRRNEDRCEFLRHTSMPGDAGTDKNNIYAPYTMDNNFHIYKIVYTSGNKQATAYIDETQIHQHSFSDEPAGKHCGLYIHEYNATEFVLDWIRVRKYTSPEPTVSYSKL